MAKKKGVLGKIAAKLEDKKESTATKVKSAAGNKVDIESAYLSHDQEQKVENIINFGEKHGYKFKKGKAVIPKGLGTMRLLIESKYSRDYLQLLIDFGQLRDPLVERAITEFDEVYQVESQQIANNTQVFIAEKDEKDQK